MTETPTPPPGDDAGLPAAGTPAPDGETVAYGETYTEPVPAAKGRRGVVIGGVAVVLALVAGAAVYAATALSGGGRQPDELAPKSTFAYFKVDLDPAAGQKLAARQFFSKIPQVKDVATGDDVFENVLAKLMKDDDLDYNRDIKPWFDKRFAVAAFDNGSGKPEVVGILRSKDDAKARASLDALIKKSKDDGEEDVPVYKIAKGYVVLSGEQAWVDDAIRLSDKESLHDNKTYRDDVDVLTGDQIAVGWADLAQAFQKIKNAVPEAGMLPSNFADLIKGRIVSGVHLTGDYAEMEALGRGVPQQVVPKSGDPALLKKLPANTVAALSVRGLGDQLKQFVNGSAGLIPGGLDPRELVNQYLAQFELNLEDDLLPLFGAESVLAFGGVDQSVFSPIVGLLTKVADTNRAQNVAGKVEELTEGEVSVEVDGDTLYAAVPPSYLDDLKGSGGLGNDAKFQKAMGDVGNVTTALYLDIQGLVSSGIFDDAGDTSDVAWMKSIGVVGAMHGSDQYFRVRLVVG